MSLATTPILSTARVLNEKEAMMLLGLIQHYLDNENLAMAEGFIRQYYYCNSETKTDNTKRMVFCLQRMQFIELFISKVLAEVKKEQPTPFQCYATLIECLKSDYFGL